MCVRGGGRVEPGRRAGQWQTEVLLGHAAHLSLACSSARAWPKWNRSKMPAGRAAAQAVVGWPAAAVAVTAHAIGRRRRQLELAARRRQHLYRLTIGVYTHRPVAAAAARPSLRGVLLCSRTWRGSAGPLPRSLAGRLFPHGGREDQRDAVARQCLSSASRPVSCFSASQRAGECRWCDPKEGACRHASARHIAADDDDLHADLPTCCPQYTRMHVEISNN